MPGPGWAAGAQIGGKVLGGAMDIFGGNLAADALKRAQRGARVDLTQGYGQGMGYQKPIYDTAMQGYQNLAGDVQGGRYSTQAPGQFQFDPQQVFQDPEYQGAMRAGTEALDSSASSGSMLFSGQHQKDLTQFGQDTFARRSDALYDRGFNAQNMNFNQNLAANQQNYGMAHDITQPMMGAANNMTDLAVNQGQDLANNTLGSGQIRAGNILRTSSALGGMAGDIGSGGADYMLGRGVPGVNQPKKVRLN
jgi:hypothetical protein